MNINDKGWISAHLFYTGNITAFLTLVISPFVKKLIKNGLVEQYFFIRYSENGPHIRLRLKGKGETPESIIKKKTADYFNKYFSANPSLRQTAEQKDWFPNNSIQWIEYVPETERYGGEEALLIAEEHFGYSSKAVLKYLSKHQSSSYSDIIGTAIQMHIGFAHAIGMNLEDIHDFFYLFYLQWLPSSYRLFGNPDHYNTSLRNIAESFFQEACQKLQPGLANNIKKLITNLNSGNTFNSEWFDDWLTESTQIDMDLQRVSPGKLLISAETRLLLMEIPTRNSFFDAHWSIYLSYTHMLNNRLGIRNEDECYIAFLIHNTLSDIKNEK